MKTIEVTIELDGSVTTRVKGGCGASCKDLTKPIRDALGVTVEDRKLPEYHLSPPATAKKMVKR